MKKSMIIIGLLIAELTSLPVVAGLPPFKLNGLNKFSQTMVTGTAGSVFNISSAGSTHTFNLPQAAFFNAIEIPSSSTQDAYVNKGGNDSTCDNTFYKPCKTIQKSVDLITDASASKPYNIYIGIGVYAETVTLKDNISLIGTNNSRTLISAVNYTGTNVQGRTFLQNLGISGSLTTDTTASLSSGINILLFNTAMGSTWTITSGSFVGNNNFMMAGCSIPTVHVVSGNIQISGNRLLGNITLDDAAGTYAYITGSRVGNSGGTLSMSGRSQAFIYGSDVTMNLSGTTASGTKPYLDIDAVSYPKNSFTPSQFIVNLRTIAQAVTYTATAASNWTTVPLDVGSALDSVVGNPFVRLMGGAGAAAATNAVLITKDGHEKTTQTTAPTAVVNSNAGTGALCALSNATDIAGNVSLTTTGVASSSGAECAITFNKAYNTAPVCNFTPTSANAILDAVIQGVFFTNSTTAATINFANTDLVGRTYQWNYQCIETQ
jgi:hypothetical protein